MWTGATSLRLTGAVEAVVVKVQPKDTFITDKAPILDSKHRRMREEKAIDVKLRKPSLIKEEGLRRCYQRHFRFPQQLRRLFLYWSQNASCNMSKYNGRTKLCLLLSQLDCWTELTFFVEFRHFVHLNNHHDVHLKTFSCSRSVH